MPSPAFPSQLAGQPGLAQPLAGTAGVTPTPTISPARVNIPAGRFACLTGIVRSLRDFVGIPFAGTHLLVNLQGQPIASLTAAGAVNLDALSGQVVTVCGVSQGVIEGITAIRATSVSPTTPFFPGLPLADPLLSLLLQNPQLLRVLLQNPGLFQLVLQNPGLLQQLLLFGAVSPGVFGAQQPGIFGLQQPGIFGLQQPGVFGFQQPGAFGFQQPGAFGFQQPGAFGFQQPGAFGFQQPGAGLL